MLAISKPVRRVRVCRLYLPLGLYCLLLFFSGCSSSDDPECLVAPLPECFDSDDGGDNVAEETQDEVDNHADDIDESVADVRDAMDSVNAALQDTVNGHLDNITANTDSIREEVEDRSGGFRSRVDTLTNEITISTANIRTATENLGANRRDEILDHLDDIDDSAIRIDDEIRDDCERTIDDDSCELIGA